MTSPKPISLFIVATIPLPFAAVQPWVWPGYGFLMIMVFLVGLWTRPSTSPVAISNQKKALAVFFIWSFFLCLPLPPSVLSILNPARAATLHEAWTLTGATPSWQALSCLPKEALAWWTFLLSLGLFGFVVHDLCKNRKTLRQMVFIMIAVGVAEATYGLIQALVPSMGVLWVDYIQEYMGTARGTFINRNHFAGFIEMIWPLALAVTLAMTGQARSLKAALGSDRLNRQALMALCIIVFLLALILTRSRAGIISGFVGFFVFSIMVRPGLRYRSKQTRLLLGGIPILLSVYIATVGIGPVIDRFLSIGNDGSSRLTIWQNSLSIVKNHPLGIGLGNFGNTFAVYNQSPIFDKTVVHAHNDYLQFFVETGWIGFCALLTGFLLFFIQRGRRIQHINTRKDPLRFFLAVGAFSGIVSISVHSLFDFNLQIPANCVYFVVLIAILGACTHPEPSISSQRSPKNRAAAKILF
jgi:O-antigen ligase